VSGKPGVELTEALQRIALPAYIIDREGVLRWANDAAIAIFGDIVGRHYSTIVAPEDLPRVREQFARKVVSGEPTEYEIMVRTADGRRVRAEISSVPLVDGGRCHAVFGLAVVSAPLPETPPKVRALTPRQHQVLQLLARGASTDQIAQMLTISPETVRNHVRHLLRALNAHSRLEAVAVARRAGLLNDG
jgi:PAS domain S-box-containing protein